LDIENKLSLVVNANGSFYFLATGQRPKEGDMVICQKFFASDFYE